MEYCFNEKRYLLKKLADTWFLVLVDQKENFYVRPYELNETGAFIFRKLCEGESEEEIAEEIVKNDRENYETIINDVRGFRKELENRLSGDL